MDGRDLNISVVLPLERLLSVIQSSQTLDHLTKVGRVSLLLPKSVPCVSEFKIFRYGESKLGHVLRDLILNSETMQKSLLVKSFETRIEDVLGLYLMPAGNYRLNLAGLISILTKPRILMSYWAYRASKFRRVRSFLRIASTLWPSFALSLLKSRPSIVVIFSGGAFSGIENVCILICRILRIPSVLIVDNWDNLNSKSIIWSSPNGLGTWGENMENDARVIHGMNPDVVRHTGSARFRPNEHEVKSIDGDFIFFAGSGKPLIDELNAVLTIRDCLDETGLQDLNLLYRPHPMSNLDLGRVRLLLSTKQRIVLDPSFDDDPDNVFYTEGPLLYLESLCKNAKVVIAPQSSIIVESLSLGTPVISLNWIDGSPDVRPLDKYTHFSELNSTASFFAVTDFNELCELIVSIVDSKSDFNLVPEILPSFTNCYKDRVAELVEATYTRVKDKK